MTDLDLYDEYLAALDQMNLATSEEEFLSALEQAIVARFVIKDEVSKRIESMLSSIQ